MACPCCATQQPSCDQCMHCEWPQSQQFTEPVPPNSTGCAVVYTFLRDVSRSYSRLELIGNFGESIVWLPGARDAISACNWTIAYDYASVSCCCPIEQQFGGIKAYIKTKFRIRVLVVESCPEDGLPTITDVTSQVLDVNASNLEGEWIPPLDIQPPCIGPSECVGDYLDFYADPDPWDICNEFP